ncbi:MAG: hypothetical protein AAF849_23565 [Bacteroidota bacterium]
MPNIVYDVHCQQKLATPHTQTVAANEKKEKTKSLRRKIGGKISENTSPFWADKKRSFYGRNLLKIENRFSSRAIKKKTASMKNSG